MAADFKFWEKVDSSGGPDACWPWTGFIGRAGYGHVRRLGRTLEAHRYAFLLVRGIMSTREQCLDHLCRNKACCNPAHLEVVSNRENVLRGKSCALKVLATHCPSGHALTPENRRAPQRTSSGAMVPGGCKTCHRNRENARRLSRRESIKEVKEVSHRSR